MVGIVDNKAWFVLFCWKNDVSATNNSINL